MSNTSQKTKLPFPWRKAFSLVKDYFFNSDEKLVAWLYLLGAIACVIGGVALITALSWWSAGFWTVFTAKLFLPFLQSMGEFSLIISGLVGVNVLKDYFIGNLSIVWRKWLTNKILSELFQSENTYLDLKRFSNEIDNLPQRIQEDVKSFVELTLRLGADFLNSALLLGIFIGTLWVVGGPLSFALAGLNIIIPGYMVWISLAFATVATVVTHAIGKSLAETNKNAERAEADFRQSLVELSDDAENVAEEHAERYYQASFKNRIQTLNSTVNQKVNTQVKLVGFQSFYNQVSFILPTLCAAPLYFAGLIEIGQVMQIGMSFAQVSFALTWFANSYEGISNYRSSIERITELQHTLERDGLPLANVKSIVRQEQEDDSIRIEHLNIKQPQVSSADYIMRNLNLKLKPGEHILIEGPSGLGKSTLFKAISGSWKYGDGTIALPAKKRFCFLPSKPTLPHDTLAAALAYPEPASTYTEEQYTAALRAVEGMDAFIPKLYEKRRWSKELSDGQQQRISFARALLKKPDWLFLDESTSSLDEASEKHVYSVVKALKGTTIVSIAHRRTVEQHHSRIVFFSVNAEREVSVAEPRSLEPVEFPSVD